MKAKLYVVALVISLVMTVGTLDAVAKDLISLGVAVWQIALSGFLGLGAVMLLRLEHKREENRIHKEGCYE